MERLRSRDFVACLEFLRRINGARSLDQLASEVLTGIQEVVPSSLTAYNEYNAVRGRNQYLVDRAGGEPRGGQAVFNAFLHEHPILRHNRQNGFGGAVKLSDFVSSAEYHRLGLYNEFFREADPPVEDLMNLCFLTRGHRVLAVALCRPKRSFSERDRLLLDLLSGHLMQAYLSAEAFELLEVAHRGWQALNEGLVLLDGRLRIRWDSGAVAGLLRTYFGAHGRNGHALPEGLSRWITHELAALDVRDDLPSPRTPLVVEKAGRRLLIRLMPHAGACALLFKEQVTTVDPELLRALPLTRREREVLAWLAQGKSDADIGTIVGASPRTVGKHLERIYSKLGVETRTGAATRALDCVSMVRS